MNIEDKIKYSIKKNSLIAKGSRVLIGVSGGADSVCLLYLLHGLKEELGAALYIAHLDHGLRKESKHDAEFVKKLAKKLKVPFFSARLDTKKLNKKLLIEEALRNARFDFFFKVAANVRAQNIALAHNFDDQAETVLMRILRGTGLYGLSAILPKRKRAKFFIIRPLLNIGRREIEDFLNKKRIKFCIDKTNVDEVYFRNKVRHRLLPLLEKEYSRNIRESLFNLAQSAGSDYDYIKEAASRIHLGGRIRLKIEKLIKLHPAIMRFKLREAISRIQGDTRRITFKHIQELEDLIFNRPIGSIVDLPKGVSILKKQKSLIFYLR